MKKAQVWGWFRYLGNEEEQATSTVKAWPRSKPREHGVQEESVTKRREGSSVLHADNSTQMAWEMTLNEELENETGAVSWNGVIKTTGCVQEGIGEENL